MSKSVRRVEQAANSLQLNINVIRMAGSTRSADDAARVCGCDVARIAKSLIFEGQRSGLLYLFLVSGAHQVDLDRAGDHAGEPLERADAQDVRSRTGFAIGGVAPIGHLETPEIWMDEALLAHKTIWAAAGAPDAVFEIDPQELLAAIGAKRISFA